MVLDKHMLVINIFDDELVIVLVVNAVDYGFDGWIAYDEDAFRECYWLVASVHYSLRVCLTCCCSRHLEKR